MPGPPHWSSPSRRDHLSRRAARTARTPRDASDASDACGAFGNGLSSRRLGRGLRGDVEETGSLDRVRERTSVHSFLFKDKKKHVRRDSFFHEELSDLFSKHLECDFIRNQKWNITMTIDIMSICTGCVLVFPWQYFDSYAACSTTPAHPPRQDVSFDLCSRPMAPSPWRREHRGSRWAPCSPGASLRGSLAAPAAPAETGRSVNGGSRQKQLGSPEKWSAIDSKTKSSDEESSGGCKKGSIQGFILIFIRFGSFHRLTKDT